MVYPYPKWLLKMLEKFLEKQQFNYLKAHPRSIMAIHAVFKEIQIKLGKDYYKEGQLS